jgi:uncharacterized protein (AIM24 family)
MKIEITHQPDSAIAHVTLDAGEELITEAGAMVAMSGFINASTTLRQGKSGGLMGGLKRMLAGDIAFPFEMWNSMRIYINRKKGCIPCHINQSSVVNPQFSILNSQFSILNSQLLI